MLSNLDPSAQQFLYSLNQISDRMTRAQQQVSSGLKLQQVSDAPYQISTLLEARASLDSTQQILGNLGRVKAEVDSGEQALESAVQLFDKVQTLGAQGNTSIPDTCGKGRRRAAARQPAPADGGPRRYHGGRALHLFGRFGPAGALHLRRHAGESCKRLPGFG